MKRTQNTLSDDAQNEQTKRRNTHPRQQECTLDTGIGSKAPTKHKTRQRAKKSLGTVMVTTVILSEKPKKINKIK